MMTKSKEKESKQDDSSTNGSEESAPESLYETELASFQESILEDLELGLKQRGFALIHSLDSADRVLVFDKMGLPCKDAIDFYNLGTAHAVKEDFKKAIEYWGKCLKMDPTFKEATFNLAVVNEKLGNIPKARKFYDQYLDGLEDAEEIELVENHLAELAS